MLPYLVLLKYKSKSRNQKARKSAITDKKVQNRTFSACRETGIFTDVKVPVFFGVVYRMPCFSFVSANTRSIV